MYPLRLKEPSKPVPAIVQEANEKHMNKTGHTGVKRIIKATGYSMQGLRAGWLYEAAVRQELIAAAFLVPLGFYLGNTAIEKVLLVGTILMVLMVELLNTAIENVVDRVSFDSHELSGRAKDMGSAAVFIALLIVLLTWGCVLLLP